MQTVNVHEAKTQLSKLLQRVLLGEEIVIAKAGRPVAKLVPISTERRARKPGTARGRMIMRDDFDDPLPPEIQRYFE